MAIELNHTIVAAHDKRESARFLTELFGLPDAVPAGPFLAVALENGLTLDFADVESGESVRPQHYAFLVSEDDFDAIYAKISDRAVPHWADPQATRPGEINRMDGGRRIYFNDPAGHFLEILTRAWGSGSG
ncbi:Glyoxalase/bleomycin resistance protein/dioxygenase [Mycolicibacterium rhodesiae JS60]|nr:Glyoxalase/bleomycin resistance protein/dioxygenase [Mycolicibacterium rhodesiae JS60]